MIHIWVQGVFAS